MKRKELSTFLPLMLGAIAVAAALFLQPAFGAGAPEEEGYARLLAAHVRGGAVDYAALAVDEALLDRYIAHLALSDPAGLGRDASLAFWINAYNAFTLRLVLDHLPGIESIREIPRAERWEARRWVVAGRTQSLDEIENEVLRPMGEPRIHFALVCAARSCPDLRSEPYAAGRLEEQLADQTRRFLADRKKGLRIEEGNGPGDRPILFLSAIFDWFEADFEAVAPSVRAFLLPYTPAGSREALQDLPRDASWETLPYDWSLNEPFDRSGR